MLYLGVKGRGDSTYIYYVATWPIKDQGFSNQALAYSATQVVTFLVWETLTINLSCLGSPKTIEKTGESRKEGW